MLGYAACDHGAIMGYQISILDRSIVAGQQAGCALVRAVRGMVEAPDAEDVREASAARLA